MFKIVFIYRCILEWQYKYMFHSAVNQGYTNCDDELQYKHCKESRLNNFPGVVKHFKERNQVWMLPYRATIIVFFSSVARQGGYSPFFPNWSMDQNAE